MSLIFNDIQFSYDEERKNIIEDLNGEFSKDRITILTGASGSGKSTLLYIAAGLYPHNAGILKGGSAMVEGVEIQNLTPRERCGIVGMMFQNPELQFCMDTVKNEMIFCLENKCVLPEKMDECIDNALDLVGITHLKNRRLVSLSGGERQKVMLACVVMMKPEWLLLDEPFANIDNDSAVQIIKKLKELNTEHGIGILAVDHRLDNWLLAADEVRIIENGKLSDTIISVDRIEGDSYYQELLEDKGIIVPNCSYGVSIEKANPSEEVLVLSHVSMSYGDDQILKDVNASFRRGMIYAVVGESGSGKSSLFNILSGMNKYKGSILFEGNELKRAGRKNVGKMGFVTQNPQDQFVGGNVRSEVLIGLKGKPDSEAISEQVLRSIKLWRYREVSPYLLSQGQQRRLGVASLMVYDCHLLVCDEPTYAQDRINTIAIMNGLAEQARKMNAAVIFSTHDPQLAKDYADVILKLEGGILNEIN